MHVLFRRAFILSRRRGSCHDEGFAEGRDEGYSAGRDEGYFEGKHLMTDIIIRIRSGNPVEQLLREGFDAADVQKACNALKIAYGA